MALIFDCRLCSFPEITPSPTYRQAEEGIRMARDGASAAAERRRVELRVLLARGGGEGSSPLPPVAEEEGEEEARRKGKQGLALLRLRGLGCASAAAAGAHAPVAAADAVRPSAEECNNGRRRRRKGKERRSARGGVAAGGGGVASGDVWCTCTPGIPFAAEASSVDCVVARQQTAGAGRRGEAERRHREVLLACLASPCSWSNFQICR